MPIWRAVRLCSRAALAAVPAGGFVAAASLLSASSLHAHADDSAPADGQVPEGTPDESDTAAQESPIVAALRAQMASLGAELEALRTHAAEVASEDAQARRLQQAVQAQEEEDSLKMLRLLQQQEKVWEAVAAERLGDQAKALAAEHAEAVLQLRSELDAAHEAALSQALDEASADFEARLEVLRQNERQAHEATRQAESASRLEQLAALHEAVESFDRAYAFDAEYKRRSHGVHALAAALFSLDELLAGRSDAPLADHLASLRSAAPEDPVVTAALSSLPPTVTKADVPPPTLAQLQHRFETVSSQARVAAYVPAGTGIFGQVVGALISALAFKEVGLVEGDDAASVVARAEHYVKAERIHDALAELDTLRGLPRTVAQDWMDAAYGRCALEQARSLLRAHATTLACALA